MEPKTNKELLFITFVVALMFMVPFYVGAKLTFPNIKDYTYGIIFIMLWIGFYISSERNNRNGR